MYVQPPIHMICAQANLSIDQPSAAYRQLEVLLGRIENLGVKADFTTQKGDFGNSFTFTAANSSMKML